MAVQEVTIQYVNLVKPGKKYGSIKTSEGQIFAVPPALLNQFGVGEVCKIDYGTWDSGGMHVKAKIGSVAPPKAVQRPSTSNSDALHIFVNGKLTAFIEKGEVHLALTEIVEAINLLVEAYNRSMLSGNKAQSTEDFNDQIPY